MNARQAADLIAAAAACGCEAPAAPAASGSEWEAAVRGGDALVLRLALREEPTQKGKRFSAKAFSEPVSAALKSFDALAPVAEMRFAAGGTEWSLRLEKPLPWPLFLRCDLAASFAPHAAQLALILRDAGVVALDFDGEALWARVE